MTNYDPTGSGSAAREDIAVNAEKPYRPVFTRTLKRTTPKVKRNDPCPCGSGKKYKRCCLVPGYLIQQSAGYKEY